MGKLKEFAEQPKQDTKGYHWKVDADTYQVFQKYCDELNLSINKALTKLVELELEGYKDFQKLKTKKKKAIRTKSATTAKPKRKRKTETNDAKSSEPGAVDEEKN